MPAGLTGCGSTSEPLHRVRTVVLVVVDPMIPARVPPSEVGQVPTMRIDHPSRTSADAAARLITGGTLEAATR